VADNPGDRSLTAFQREVEERFGILPNFFCTAKSAPGLIEELWGFAKSAYLDSPFPSLFKERLFVHLSRFCEVRYCIIRHVGFLIGHGRPAGDRNSPAATVEQVIALLRRAVPDARELTAVYERLGSSNLATLPEPDTQAEADLFDALTIMFVDPTNSAIARQSIKAAVGDSTFELFAAYLAFVRTAHYWTETHPELDWEPDMLELMSKHSELSSLLRNTSEAERAKERQDVLRISAQLKQTEHALRAREERYGQLVEQTPDGLFEANAEGRYVDVNPAGCEMLGMTREEVLTSGMTDVLVPEEHHRLVSEILRFEGVNIVRSEWRMRRKNGSVFDAEIVGRRLPNGNLQGFVRDVSEDRRREAALRESEAFTRRVLESSSDCIKVLSLEGALLFMSPGGERVMEVEDFAQLKGACWTDFWNGEDHKKALAAVSAAKSGHTGHFRGYAPTAKGNMKYWDVVVSPISGDDGIITSLLAISRDISDQQAAEDALRDSEERFRTMADNISQLAWTCDQLGEVTWYNQRWLEYTGLSFEQMRDWGWRQVHHPDHADRVVAGVKRSRESGEPWEDTFPLRGVDGNYRWFLSRAVPVRNAAGEIVRWFGTNTDITEQRKADETQRMLTNELSHRVKNMLATVQAIATQTLRHNKNPGQFVTGFGGRIQSMSRMHSMLSSSDWQGAELRDIIRDQLFLGPIDDTKVTAWGPAVHLEPQFAPQFAMMLHELGTNSIKYGALSKADGVVTISWIVSDDMLCLRWAERGGPQIGAPVKRGFGSALIEQTARVAGGSASMSIEAVGVQWEISLPLPRQNHAPGSKPSSKAEFVKAEAPSDEAGHTNAAPPILAGKRFLVVEDEPLVALEIVASLEQAGIEVAGSVGSPSEALALIERATLDAALLDGNLHGQSVGEIAAALTRKNVPFVFVTGYGRESLPPAFAGSAALSKPFSQQQLFDAAAKLVQTPADVYKLKGCQV
jgi:PAS domain S-box-containing protein